MTRHPPCPADTALGHMKISILAAAIAVCALSASIASALDVSGPSGPMMRGMGGPGMMSGPRCGSGMMTAAAPRIKDLSDFKIHLIQITERIPMRTATFAMSGTLGVS